MAEIKFNIETEEKKEAEKKEAKKPNVKANSEPKTETKKDEDEIVWEESKPEDFITNLYEKKKAPSTATLDIDPDYTEDKLNADIPKLASGQDADQNFSAYDLYELAYVLVDMLDMLNSSWACSYSRDAELNATHFEITEKKKKRIAKNLAVLLYKWQVKIGPVFVLLLGLLLAFGGTWKKAYSIRKGRLKEERKILKQKLSKKQQHQSQTTQKSIMEVLKAGERTIKQLMVVFPKRKMQDIRNEIKKLMENNLVKADTSSNPYKYSLVTNTEKK